MHKKALAKQTLALRDRLRALPPAAPRQTAKAKAIRMRASII